jgi:Flp pilus assembly protein TadG
MTATPARRFRGLAAFTRRFWADRAGALAVTFAIWVPIGAVLVAGAIDLAAVNATHQAMRDVADAAALDGARQMGLISNTAVAARVNANVSAQLAGQANLSYSVNTTFNQDPGRVTVAITGNRTSFFGNLLPPGGWSLSTSSTAEQMGTMPLCVLTTGTGSNDDIDLMNSSRMTAAGCLVHANSDIAVRQTSILSAGIVQAAGLASGQINPSPQSDAPQITDPFANMSMNPLLPLCLPVTTLVANVVTTLLPGVHCGDIDVAQGGTLYLLPGEHYFLNGTLRLRQNARIQGSNVVLFFDSGSKFQFTESSDIRLQGRQSGPYAGFVLATTRNNTNTFEISSTAARELLGTVYIPNATLRVLGTSPIADQSAWTVIVAKTVRLEGSANLVINHNYAGSSVPVPGGVGPSAAATQARLAH